MTDKKIVFKASNGMSPSCTFGEYKYFINEKRSRFSGQWVYQLERRKTTGNEEKSFKDYEKAEAYYKGCIVGQKGENQEFCHSVMFLTKEKIYSLSYDNKVKIVNNAEVISEEFNTYKECVKFAERFISKLDEGLF